MKLKLLMVGKTSDKRVDEWFNEYLDRLSHYCKVEASYLELKSKKKMGERDQKKEEEGKLILSQLSNSSYLILLDERGQTFDSLGFSKFLQKKMNAGHKEIILCIGGAYGFSEEVYSRANEKLALSKMTLTHQMVRLFAVEQMYRAFTILRGENYHH